MPNEVIPAAKRKRRRFVFSVRTLIVAILVFGVVMGWKVRKAVTQKEAVAAVQKAGGYVVYEDEIVNGKQTFRRNSFWPEWLVARIGEEYFREVYEVDFYEETMTDDELIPVGTLGRLQVLRLAGSKLTDAGLAHLKGLSHLRELNLEMATFPLTDASMIHLARLTALRKLDLHSSTLSGFKIQHRISNVGLAQLSKLVNLEEIALDGRSGISETGLMHLAKLPHLKHLTILYPIEINDACLAEIAKMFALEKLIIGYGPITDAGVAQLAALTHLRELSPQGNAVTGTFLKDIRGLRLEVLDLSSMNRVNDSLLRELKEMKSLRNLDIAATEVTDAGMAIVAGLPNLEKLNINTTLITDSGLSGLCGLKGLKALDVRSTRVSEEGVAKIKAAIPGLKISTDFGNPSRRVRMPGIP